MKILKTTLALVALVALLYSCEKEESGEDSNESALKTATFEDFEGGSKSSYAAASVTLGSGTWYFEESLLGSLSNDRKNGLKSVRIRNTGTISMQFNKSSGAGTISVYHAKYGSDGNSTWSLNMSTDNGNTWMQIGGIITTSSTTLQKADFEVNQSGDVRFKIAKLSGGSNRINIEDLSITDYGNSDDDGDGDGDGDNGGGDSSGSGTDDDHLMLGNPSDAVASIVAENNYLMDKGYYKLGYSNEKLIPIWVCWHLEDDDFGSAERQDDFRSDSELPSSWYKVGSSGYSGSGFDRGHMCPSADRKFTVEANSSTFFMTNMIPQAPNNNRVTWGALETYSRSLVDNGKELYIISGPYGQGGTGSKGDATTIGNGIAVPSHTWKIIVVLDDGNNDISRISKSTRVIAVFMPNNMDVNDYGWEHYRTSVDYIESLTGFDFLSNVSSSIESVLESQVDDTAI